MPSIRFRFSTAPPGYRIWPAVREARTLYAGNSTLAAQITTREAEALRAKADLERSRAELDRAQADLRRAQDDAARREPLLASGAVAREEYDHARSQAQSFSGQVAAAQSAVQADASANLLQHHARLQELFGSVVARLAPVLGPFGSFHRNV